MKGWTATRAAGPSERTAALLCGVYSPYMAERGAWLTHRMCSSMPIRERYSENSVGFVRRSVILCVVRSSLALGTTMSPRPAQTSTPSHGTQVPMVRFSGGAISRRIDAISRCQQPSSRRARCTPTTARTASSVYCLAKYRRL